GSSVTFTATVAGSTPTGLVSFTSDGSTISGCGAVTLTGSGNSRTATCSTTSLTVGSHSIVASYGGDAFNATSTSSTLSQSMTAAPASTTTTLTSSANPAQQGNSV